MKRTTLSALLLGMVLALGMTSTSNAQFSEETSWSSSRTSSTNETWSAGFGGTTFRSQQTFGGHDEMTTMRVSPDRFQRSEMRSDFGGYNEIGRMSRPAVGGIENTGYNNSGAWRTSNGAYFNMGQGGDYARGVNTFSGFDSSSGFREIGGFGGGSGTRFNNHNEFGGGNTWTRGW
ncbi:MAG: hypothetical protein ACKO9H_05425 [Planctomycetota bacterium]